MAFDGVKGWGKGKEAFSLQFKAFDFPGRFRHSEEFEAGL